MSSGRYYFPELPEHNALCVIANLSKQTLKEGEQIVEVLRNNYSILYEQSPRKISFMKEDNNQSIFDLSPKSSEIVKQQKGNISSIEQSSEQMSTPVNRNPCLPRKYLSIDEAEKDCTDKEATDTSQKRTFYHKDDHIIISNPSDHESAMADKVTVTPSTSKSPKSTGSPHAENEESPRSAQTVVKFSNLNVEEDESSELAKTDKTTDTSATNTNISTSPHQIVKNYQHSTDLNEERQTSNSITKIKHTPSPIKKSKISDNYATNIQVFDSPTRKSDSTQNTKALDLSIKGNKMCSSPIKWNKSLEIAEVKRKSPSPRRNTLLSTVTPKIICSIRYKEFGIELPRESDENCSHATRSNLSRDFKLDGTMKSSRGEKDDLKGNIKNSKFFESKRYTSPKITDVQSSPCKKNTCSGSPTSLAKGNKMCSSPIKWNKSVKAEVKRKSPSPRRNTLFSTVTPKICSISMKEFDIELPWETDENSSPTTRSNLSRDFKLDGTVKSSRGEIDNLKDNIKSSEFFQSKDKTSPKTTDLQLSPCEKNTCSSSPTCLVKTISPRIEKNQNPVKSISPPVVPSKIVLSPKFIEHPISPLKGNVFQSPHNLIKVTSPDTGKGCFPILDLSPTSRPLSATLSPKTMECKLSHSEKQECTEFPQNVTKMDSPSEDTDYASKKSSPSTSSRVAISTDDVGSCSAELKTIENSDSKIINSFRNKLTRLISMRDDCMNESFENFSKFQKELLFLFIFVRKIAYVVKKLQTEGKEYVTKELEDVTSELIARAFKLAENLNLWKSAGDLEVQTWIQYFEEIKNVKSNYETRISSVTSPLNCMRILRQYEKNLKSVWKKMIDMRNLEDTRRSSLINSSFEFEMLIKQFVKCLIIVGIVKRRSETAFA